MIRRAKTVCTQRLESWTRQRRQASGERRSWSCPQTSQKPSRLHELSLLKKQQDRYVRNREVCGSAIIVDVQFVYIMIPS